MSELDDGDRRPPADHGPPADHLPPEPAVHSGAADPWASPPGWPELPPRPRVLRWRDVACAAVIALAVAALGAPLGVLWSWLGPHVDIVMTNNGADLSDYNTEAFVAGDGRYALITGVVGVVCGAGAWLLKRWRGPALVVGLAVGSLAGSYLTWKVGVRIGVAEYDHLLEHARLGEHFGQPMKLRAEGLVYLQPIVAVVVYVVHAAWSKYPDLLPSVSSPPSAPVAAPAAPAPPAGETASSPPA